MGELGPQGLLIAAPASGSGKTFLTLAILRALRRQGRAVSSIKVGPDYIDPAFHRAASGRDCFNLDGWAMSSDTLAGIVGQAGSDSDLIIGEGVMGLFDGAVGGGGSTADLSVLTGWPVILVVPAAGMGASVAALVEGFQHHRADLSIAGLIFNGIGGERHESLLRNACAGLDVPVIGAIPKQENLRLPSRHLGLVQAGEHAELESFLEAAASHVTGHMDLAALAALAEPSRLCATEAVTPPAFVLGQRTAVARDQAFAFAYPHLLSAWRAAGVEVSFFSPLADEAPATGCDSVFLPGGYPELHGGRLAANQRYQAGLRRAADRGSAVYGECGGYMALGEGLIDGEGCRHTMAGLLPLETSFAAPSRRLGYRQARLLTDGPLGSQGRSFLGHEFHYAVELDQRSAFGSNGTSPLFAISDAGGTALPEAGQRVGPVMGSFLHLIDGQGTAAS